MRCFISLKCCKLSFATLCCLLCMGASPCFAGYKKHNYDLFVSGKMIQWSSTIDSIMSAPKASFEDRTSALIYAYGLIGHYIDQKKSDKAQPLLQRTLDWIRIMQKENNKPVLQAILSNLQGFQISLSPLRAPFIYRSMVDNASDAAQSDSNNAITNILYGNILFYMPSVFGGDSQKALKYYQKALSIFRSTPGDTENNWLYIQLLTTIGLVYQKENNFSMARNYFDEVMRIAPNYGFVKYKLYPNLLKQYKP